MSEATETWQAFLDSRGAPPRDPGRPLEETRAETEAAHDRDVFADLSSWSLIGVRGPDAQTFLQGQFSNDIREVTSERSQLSAWCTPKGRMLAIFRVFRRGEDYLLQLPSPLRSETARRLRMFVLRAKVTVDDGRDDLIGLGLSGPNAGTILSGLGCVLPAPEGGVSQTGAMTLIALPGPHPRYQIVVPLPDAPRLWDSLAASARPVGTDAWAWLNIQAGLPEVLPGTVEEFVPQMTNLDLLQGVNFTKGCYPGQEIVARVKYLGRIKQRMFPAWCDGSVCPAPGTAIVPAQGDGQAVGWVVDGRAAPSRGCDMLVVVGLDQRASDLRLVHVGGPGIELRNSPYPVGDGL